jgi:hypothetical protein
MTKIRNIITNLILEAQRYKFSDDVRDRMKSVTEKLWSDRNKPYKGKELVDVIPFKLADGVEGLARVVVNPRLPYMGQMGTKPQKSVDPADIVIEVNPKHYESKKTLYLTLYHEMIHASDPTQSHLFSPKYMVTYNEKSDKDYWGHPIEFFAISNEFLEGLVLEFERRVKRNRKIENLQFLEKSLKNIINYFAKGDPLSKLSKDILFRINDEHLGNDLIRVFKNLTTDNPQLADFMSERGGEEPYYIYYVELIKKYNPEIWKKFLSMLYQTGFEIRDLIQKTEI